MSAAAQIYVFGEVLFDCFPDGAKVLGGAPFNVAWHLQALGDQPQFISRIGEDQPGRQIAEAMADWGLEVANLQTDRQHPTGRVDVSFKSGEPSYDIVADCAYDFISADQLQGPFTGGILYHGSLCLRHPVSAKTLERLSAEPEMKIFLDVNLRPPWWQQQQLELLLQNATWVKMNQDELQQLGKDKGDLNQQMEALQEKFNLQQLILTRGEEGALVRTRDGQRHSVKPSSCEKLVDTVGAGDAFSAVYIHGLRHGWPIEMTLQHAQNFASRVIGLRGATTTESEFYRQFLASLDAPSDTR